MQLSEEQRKILQALIDRIIPADDYPSASENGVTTYIERLLQTDLKHRGDEVQLGLRSLNEEAVALNGKPFADQPTETQDKILGQIESSETNKAVWITPSSRFFELMVRLTNEGYYADAGNGANVDGISWKMIGYEPRVPAVPVRERWLEKNS